MSLQCPYCEGYRAECEDLPREQETWRPIKCGNESCGKVYLIRWYIEHDAMKLSDATFGAMSGKLMEEIAEVAKS